jgi:putative drug exporter of the RND superfamily
MALLDEHAWYIPRWLDKITPNIDIEGSEHLARLAAAHAADTRTPTLTR